jgi:cytochrome c oxidase subunit 2
MAMRSRRTGATRLLQRALVVATPLVTAGCLPAGISGKANDVHRLFYYILWLALPVFLFVEGMLLISVFWFRKRRGDDSEPPQIPGNNRALVAFFAGPLVIVVALLAVGEVVVGKVDYNDPHPAERVVITGSQWQWSATYVNEQVSLSGKTPTSATSPIQQLVMELPVNTATRVTLKSTDVIHEFYVPNLLFMKNAVPGHPNVVTITPTKLGTYRGRCAQFCGLWHWRMTFLMKVVTPPEFHHWIAQQKHAATAKGACQPSSSWTLIAHHISWDKSCIAVPAGKPFQLTIKNLDSGIAHDFGIWQSPALKHLVFATKPKLTGVATKTYTVPALPLKPGKYYFQCNIHGPAMAGTFVVVG